MLERMAKVRIYGNRRRLHEFVEALRAAGVVHLTSVKRRAALESDEFEVLTPIEADEAGREKLERVREELRWVEQAAALLGVGGETAGTGAALPGREALKAEIDRLRETVAERDRLVAEAEVARRYQRLAEAFGPVLREMGELRFVRAVGVTLDIRYRDRVIPLIRERMEKATGGGYQMLWRKLDEETVGVVLVFPPSAAEEVAALLAEENIHEMRLPESYEAMPFLAGIARVEKRLAEIPSRLADVEAEIAAARARYGGLLAAEKRRLARQLGVFGAVGEMVSSRFLFVAEGFVPLREVGPLRAALAARLGDEVRVAEVPIPDEERHEVPVVFVNRPVVRPFERLLTLLPKPKYGTIDPSGLMALTFPFFFGLILGDVGYGLIALLLAGLLRWRAREPGAWRDVAALLAVAAVVSILFGFVYGEFFGDAGHRLGILKPLWRDRMEAAAALLVFTIGVGAAHVVLSFVLGAVHDFRQNARSAALAKLVSVAALAAVFALVAAVAGYLPKGGWLIPTLLLAAAVVLLLYLEGLVAALELVTAVGNILSYTRLMALGLASAALAIVANRLAGATGNLAAAIVVAALLHGLNLVLGIFGPTLHGLRLHYVEFLPRFYEYGGRTYRPFGGDNGEKGVAP